MNTVVLVIAGIFVLTGGALIILSIVLFRKRTDKREEGTLPWAESPSEELGHAFIDEPLEIDFSLELGPVSPIGREAAAAATSSVQESDVRQISYSFRVAVADDHVAHGRLRDAITEYEKALTLTDDRDLRSHILIEVGNAWRDLDDRESAAHAYAAAAAEQTADETLRAQLRNSTAAIRPEATAPTENDSADEEGGQQ